MNDFALQLTPAERRWFGVTSPFPEIDALLERAKAAWERLTPDEQAHHRHEQRISFAAGNLAIDGTLTLEQYEAFVRNAAGPCPCGPCSLTPRTRTRRMRPELIEAFAEACRD